MLDRKTSEKWETWVGLAIVAGLLYLFFAPPGDSGPPVNEGVDPYEIHTIIVEPGVDIEVKERR